MYALVDCNNFYCSCERVFEPRLANRPVVVLSNNDGCVISRSEEAKALGIKMGAPSFLFADFFKKHHVVVYSSNYTLYGDISNRVMKTIAELVPRFEVYSIDEAFLDLYEFPRHDLAELGKKVKESIIKKTGIPVTLGIAATKTLAKMANKYAKRNRKDTGVFWASNDQLIDEMLASTDVGDIWGIGEQYAKFLKKNKFTTALGLRDAPQEWVRANMTVVGQRLLTELRGMPAIQWQAEEPAKKNICTARGFGELLKTKHEVGEALASYASICAGKLRKQKSCTRMIEVFIETNPFRREDKQFRRSIRMQLPVATNHTANLIKQAMKALDIIYAEGFNYHKCGIVVMDLVPEEAVQYPLYDVTETLKEKQLSSVIDQLNKSLGKDLVRFASQGYSKKWPLKQMKLSPCYTTRIEDILKVKN